MGAKVYIYEFCRGEVKEAVSMRYTVIKSIYIFRIV
jgi:hypothetical protein